MRQPRITTALSGTGLKLDGDDKWDQVNKIFSRRFEFETLSRTAWFSLGATAQGIKSSNDNFVTSQNYLKCSVFKVNEIL